MSIVATSEWFCTRCRDEDGIEHQLDVIEDDDGTVRYQCWNHGEMVVIPLQAEEIDPIFYTGAKITTGGPVTLTPGEIVWGTSSGTSDYTITISSDEAPWNIDTTLLRSGDWTFTAPRGGITFTTTDTTTDKDKT